MLGLKQKSGPALEDFDMEFEGLKLAKTSLSKKKPSSCLTPRLELLKRLKDNIVQIRI